MTWIVLGLILGMHDRTAIQRLKGMGMGLYERTVKYFLWSLCAALTFTIYSILFEVISVHIPIELTSAVWAGMAVWSFGELVRSLYIFKKILLY